MQTSPNDEVRKFYDDSAEQYSAMMDREIALPMYGKVLALLARELEGLHGPVVDSSCGSGHMLARYHADYEPTRELIGIDLSPQMVDLARTRLGASAEVQLGDMRKLEQVETSSAAALISFFSLHHLDSTDAAMAFKEWYRVLVPGGKILVATWEGQGPIDYGDHSTVVALRFREQEVSSWAIDAGFSIDRCVIDPVDGMPMDAIYLIGSRAA